MEIVKESKKPYLRGINEKLATKFKESSLCTLVKEDKDLLACIRNNAIGIYHHADKVAMVHCNREGELVCDVNDFCNRKCKVQQTLILTTFYKIHYTTVSYETNHSSRNKSDWRLSH